MEGQGHKNLPREGILGHPGLGWILVALSVVETPPSTNVLKSQSQLLFEDTASSYELGELPQITVYQELRTWTYVGARRRWTGLGQCAPGIGERCLGRTWSRRRPGSGSWTLCWRGRWKACDSPAHAGDLRRVYGLDSASACLWIPLTVRIRQKAPRYEDSLW